MMNFVSPLVRSFCSNCGKAPLRNLLAYPKRQEIDRLSHTSFWDLSSHTASWMKSLGKKKVFVLKDIDISRLSWAGFCAALKQSQVEYLVLDNFNVDRGKQVRYNSVLKLLDHCSEHPHLKTLRVSSSELDDEEAVLIARYVKDKKLRVRMLGLERNNIGLIGLHHLADAISKADLLMVNLTLNMVSTADVYLLKEQYDKQVRAKGEKNPMEWILLDNQRGDN